MDEDLKTVRALHNVYRATFSSVTGQEVLADLSHLCNEFRSNFSTDAMQLAYLSGQRDVILHIRNMIEGSFLKDNIENYIGEEDG